MQIPGNICCHDLRMYSFKYGIMQVKWTNSKAWRFLINRSFDTSVYVINRKFACGFFCGGMNQNFRKHVISDGVVANQSFASIL